MNSKADGLIVVDVQHALVHGENAVEDAAAALGSAPAAGRRRTDRRA